MATGAPSATAQAQEKADTSAASFNIKNTNVREGNGVKLDEHQRLLVGSVLDVRGASSFLPFFFSSRVYVFSPSFASLTLMCVKM